jgi:hypothetical protein
MSAKGNRNNKNEVSESEALLSAFTLPNPQLAERVGKPYHTIGNWRFKWLNNKLSDAHKSLILESLGYELKNERTWLKKQ